MKNILNGKVVLITGGTGSFGRKATKVIFKNYKPKKIIILSRDEFKQYEMSKVFPENKYPIRYFLGDVRDKNRLRIAFDGVDYVIHAAALKQVPALEYNPTEAIKTNIVGAENIIDAAMDSGVKKIVAISTDKAANPVNLYGATKLVAEKVFIAANAFCGGRINFSVVRYGNVAGSRGSVIPLFMNLKEKGVKEFPITDLNMSRFWITLEDGVNLVLYALANAVGGELFVPSIPSVKITDLAKAIEPECKFKIIGIRPGEKIHEVLISSDDARSTKVIGDMFVILPQFEETDKIRKTYMKYLPVPQGFEYASNTNEKCLSVKEIREIIKKIS